MQILITCATPFESEGIRAHFGIPLLPNGQVFEHRMAFGSFLLLHTGIGMVNTSWHLGRFFQSQMPEMAIQFGIAGAFPSGPELLDVVEITEEIFGDLGADSPEGFLDLEKMGFAHFESKGTTFYNTISQTRSATGLYPRARSVSVNRVTGTAEGVLELKRIWNPDIENMEGAAFFQACMISNVPFRAFRTISNRVEPRNRETWKIKDAISKMNEEMIQLLENPEKFNTL